MSDSVTFPQRDPADAKAWFYLDRRADIEAWAAQRGDAAKILEKYLRALAAPLTEMADEVGAEVDLDDIDGETYQVMSLRRSSWTYQGFSDVSVAIEWERGSLLDPDGRNEWPFIGVRAVESSTDKERWRQLQTALAPARKRLAGKAYRPWPFWRYEMPSANSVAVDPEQLARGLLTSFRELWDEVAPILDAAHHP